MYQSTSTSRVLFTVEQAASQLQVSKSNVYSLIERGRLACHRIGVGRGTIRISQEDFDAILQSCHQGEFVEEQVVPRRTKLKHIQL